MRSREELVDDFREPGQDQWHEGAQQRHRDGLAFEVLLDIRELLVEQAKRREQIVEALRDRVSDYMSKKP